MIRLLRSEHFWRGFFSGWGHPYTIFFLGGSLYGLALGWFFFR